MPRKAQSNHPVRQVRTILKLSQASFATTIGCSTIAVQRIENGSLKLSSKLANAIMEATGAEPASLRKPDGEARDMMGHKYSLKSFEFRKKVLPVDESKLKDYVHTLVRYTELLLIASERGGKSKADAVFSAIQESLKRIAEDFRLEESIEKFLLEKGSFRERSYRVSDLRKFSDYAQILGFKDDKRYSPEKVVKFKIPRGWILDYLLYERPVLPHGADMKLRDAEYILDEDRPIPDVIKDALKEAEYWEIIEFRG
jgi:DNA-binding transcriptional regulator YiaG